MVSYDRMPQPDVLLYGVQCSIIVCFITTYLYFLRIIFPYMLFLLLKNNKLYLVYVAWLNKIPFVPSFCGATVLVYHDYCRAMRRAQKYVCAYASVRRNCAYATLDEEFISDYSYYM